MVVFRDGTEKYNSPEMFLKVQNEVAKVMELNKQLQRMEEEIVLNPNFVKKSIGSQEDDVTHTKGFSNMEQ